MKLGLPQGHFAELIDASLASVLNWETGKAKPGAKATQNLIAIRGMGNREDRRILAAKGDKFRVRNKPRTKELRGHCGPPAKIISHSPPCYFSN